MQEQFIPHWEQVKDNTWCICTDHARIPVYFLDECRVILLDSGLPGNKNAVLSLLEQKHAQVVAILTSHTHPDHIGNHNAIREKYGAKIYMTPFAAATCMDPLTMYATLGGRAGFRPIRDRMGMTVPADVMIPWGDGQITVEGATFQVVASEGHCAEHVSFITPDNVAYLGDALQSADYMQHLRLIYSTGLEAELDSKRKLAQLHCDKYILAHNGVVDDIAETARIAIEEIEKRLDIFVQLADTPATVDEMVRRFLVHSGADLSNWRTVHGVHYNAYAFLSYLADTKRLEIIAEDGYMKYVRPQ